MRSLAATSLMSRCRQGRIARGSQLDVLALVNTVEPVVGATALMCNCENDRDIASDHVRDRVRKAAKDISPDPEFSIDGWPQCSRHRELQDSPNAIIHGLAKLPTEPFLSGFIPALGVDEIEASAGMESSFHCSSSVRNSSMTSS